MDKTYIFLDTNNWIYLANGFNIQSNEHDDLHYKVFDIIDSRVADGSLVFLVNDIVLSEFERNKERTEDKIKDIENKKTAYNNTLKAMKKFIPDDKDAIDQIRIDIKTRAEQKISAQKEHALKVEDFLKNKTKKIKITVEHKAECSDMSVAKKAPFIGDKRNSAADAILLLSAVDHIKKHEKISWDIFDESESIAFFPKSYFVSSNTGDFCDPQDNKKIHADLEPILARSETKFYYSLNPLINLLEQELLSREEEAFIDDAEDGIHCELCEYEFSRVDFSHPFKIFDPHLVKTGILDQAQLPIFNEMPTNVEYPYVMIRTAQCDHCGTDFLECPNCDELVQINDYNVEIPCPGCDYSFILNAERDRKGVYYEGEYEIVINYKCSNCGEKVDSVNSSGMCGECVEYENIAEQN